MRTVVAFFEDRNAAEKAVQELTSSGIVRDRVDISKGRIADDDHYNDKSEEKDGITKFFENLFGGNDNDKDRYSYAARNSDRIVTVHAQTEEEARRAADILDNAGAEDVDEMADRYASPGNTGTEFHRRGRSDMEAHGSERISGQHSDERYESQRSVSGQNENSSRSIPVINENVEIGKREVQTGGVRMRSRIIERPVEETLRLREEHVRVDRRKVDRPATDADLRNMKDGTIEIKEHKEVPVVKKNARVVEEVRVQKEVVANQHTVRDTEKRTDIDMQKMEDRTGLDRSDHRNDVTGTSNTTSASDRSTSRTSDPVKRKRS